MRSRLPGTVFVAAFGLAAFVLAACSPSPAADPAPEPPPATELTGEDVRLEPHDPGEPAAEPTVLAREHVSGVEERRREVISAAGAWAGVWEEIYANRSPGPALQEVDFDRSVVVLASMGVRSSGGYSIDAEEIRRDGADVVVVVRERSPGPSCMVSAALTQPVVAVLVPRTEGDVVFEERTTTSDCD